MFVKVISSLAPISAILAGIYLSLTGYSVLCAIGSTLREDQEIVLPSGHLIGVMGLVLFGIGVTATTLSPRTRSAGVLSLLIGGMMAFGIAVLLIGFGSWQLGAAFQSLATTAMPDVNSFI